MTKLRDRQRQVPGGFKFEMPQLGYKAPTFASFNVIVDAVLALILANPDKAEKYKWPVTWEGVAQWVDEHNARLCASYGWKDFIIEDAAAGEAQYRPDLWPLWARTMAALKAPEDKGVGDTVERVIGKSNSEALKKFYLRTFGRACNCDGRRDIWNLKYPYQ